MQIKSIITKIKKLILSIIIMIIPFMQSCLMTSNGFTGRTIERGKIHVSPAVDYLVISDEEDTEFGFYPSFGLDLGLPLRSETGLKYYPLYFFKGSLRTQLTPRDWHDWQLGTSVDLCYTSISSSPLVPFFRLTAGYQTGRVTPFINISYSPIELYGKDRYIQYGMGAGIPIGPKGKQNIIIPEIMIGNRDGYMLSFGLGFRLSGRKKQKE